MRIGSLALLLLLSACPSCPNGAEGEGEGVGEEGEGEGEGGDNNGFAFSLVVTGDRTVIHLTKRDADGFCVTDPTGTSGPQASSCDAAPLDCNSLLCLADWDDIDGDSAGDPQFGRDPDRVSVEALAVGDYLFSAHRQGNDGEEASVGAKIYADGQVGGEWSAQLVGDSWVEFSIIVARDDGTICVEDLQDGSATDDCAP